MSVEFSRRQFVQVCTAVGSYSFLPRYRVTVGASSTVFFGHPRGESNLVRFTADNIDAPAGRLRVYDTQRRLLGTAGMLGVGRTLFGELWLNVSGNTRIDVELEAPGLRGPLRSWHVLAVPRRWTLHWLTIADPAELIEQLDAMGLWARTATATLLRETGVTGNPYASHQRAADGIDHLDYFRIAMNAIELERRYGVPASPTAIAQSRDLRLNAAPLVLAGAGVKYALLLDDEYNAFHVYTGRDGSRLVTASPAPGGTPGELGFGSDREGMAVAIERWLTTSPGLRETVYPADAALVVSSEIEPDRAAMVNTVTAWEERFAYPRITIGGADEFFDRIATLASPRALFSVSNPMPFRAEPDMRELTNASVDRAQAIETRVQNLVEPLNRLVGAASTRLDDFAATVDFVFDGTLVFNPSPLPRTDVVRSPDGTERMVTHIPGLGYVFIPDAARVPPNPNLQPGDATISGNRFALRLDPVTGAIESMYQRDVRRQWADGLVGGFNEVPTSRLLEVQRYRMPGVGARLVALRRTTWGMLSSTYTVYDEVPWVDIENSIENLGRTPVRYGFAFDFDVSTVSWETAGGYESQTPPTTNFAHLRWLSLQGPDRSAFLLRCVDHPFARVDTARLSERQASRANLFSITPGGHSRYRVDTMSPNDPPDTPWKFGWHGEPLIATRVQGGGRVAVPRFAQLMSIDPGVMVLAIKEADDGFGIIVFLQEVTGLSREVRLRPDLVQFEYAHLVDLAERDRGDALPVTEDGVRVPVQRFGITAVRLSQLRLHTLI